MAAAVVATEVASRQAASTSARPACRSACARTARKLDLAYVAVMDNPQTGRDQKIAVLDASGFDAAGPRSPSAPSSRRSRSRPRTWGHTCSTWTAPAATFMPPWSRTSRARGSSAIGWPDPQREARDERFARRRRVCVGTGMTDVACLGSYRNLLLMLCRLTTGTYTAFYGSNVEKEGSAKC